MAETDSEVAGISAEADVFAEKISLRAVRMSIQEAQENYQLPEEYIVAMRLLLSAMDEQPGAKQ